MSSEALAYGEPLVAAERPPLYGDGQLAYERPPVDVEAQVDRGHDWTLTLVIFMPVLAAYGAIAYGLYVAAHAIL